MQGLEGPTTLQWQATHLTREPGARELKFLSHPQKIEHVRLRLQSLAGVLMETHRQYMPSTAEQVVAQHRTMMHNCSIRMLQICPRRQYYDSPPAKVLNIWSEYVDIYNHTRATVWKGHVGPIINVQCVQAAGTWCL